MRISRIKVNNFKSLVDFDLPMEKFTCLIGLNGSGKSTVLQFLDFLGQIVRGTLANWLSERDWEYEDLASKLTDCPVLDFEVNIEANSGEPLGRWIGKFRYSRIRCVEETIQFGHELIRVQEDTIRLSDQPDTPITFKYNGSILSQLQDDVLPPLTRQFRDFLQSSHSLDTLTPDYLRQRTRDAHGTLGYGGRQLSAYLSELSQEKYSQVNSDLEAIYQKDIAVGSRTLRSGWKQLQVAEPYLTAGQMLPRMTTEAKHVNDGTLRLISFFAELVSEHELIALDEIENGINPEIVERLVEKLVHARQQIVVTTHSPMILNYLEDEVAKKSVVYLYKTDAGHTKAIRFFDIPSMAEKLKVMGPGEVFVDTKLSALAGEIAALSKAGAP